MGIHPAQSNARHSALGSCPICAVPFSEESETVVAKWASTDVPISFYHCLDCQCWFAPEAAAAASALYSSRDSNNYAPNKSAWMKAVQQYFLGRQYLQFVKARGITAVVDYGCGSGTLSNALAGKNNISVYAIDVQSQRPPTLDDGVVYFGSSAVNIPSTRGKTAFILRHVLEHFEHPVQDLRKIAELANSGDVFVVETPTADSYFRSALSSGWPGYYPPYHVTVPTLTALKKIASRANLRFETSQRREPPILGSYFARNAASATNKHRMMGIVCYPIQFLANKLTGRSEAIEVILVKP